MMKIFKYFFAVFMILFLILPVLALADEKSSPQSTQQADISCDQQYPWCKDKSGDIAGLVKNFYNYALAAVGVAALGAIIFGGVKYTVSAGNPSGQADAISWITGAVWGLVLLLGANLLLRTINPQLVNLEMIKLEGVKVEQKTTQPNQRPGEAFKDTKTVERNDVVIKVKLAGKDKDITSQAKNFTLKNNASIDGTKKETLAEVAYLGNEGASTGKFNPNLVIITSGTDGQHEADKNSHASGNKVDLRANQQMSNYIESVPSGWKKLNKGDMGGKCFENECYLSPRGAIYNKEKDHWDILVK